MTVQGVISQQISVNISDNLTARLGRGFAISCQIGCHENRVAKAEVAKG